MVSGGDGMIEQEAIYSHIEMYKKKTEKYYTKAILPSAELWWHGSAYTLCNCGCAHITLM